MMLNTTKYTAMALLGVGLAFAATPASACGAYGYAGYGYGGSGYGYRSYGGCGAYGYAGYRRPYYGGYGYAGYHRPYYGAYGYARGNGSYGGCGAYGYVPVRHYGGCGAYGYAGYRRPYYGGYGYSITAHITGLMDTHHSSRGIAFIDRFMLSRVISPAIAPLATRRTGCGC